MLLTERLLLTEIPSDILSGVALLSMLQNQDIETKEDLARLFTVDTEEPKQNRRMLAKKNPHPCMQNLPLSQYNKAHPKL